MVKNNWLNVSKFKLPGRYGRQVKLLVDFDTGEHEINGSAILLTNGNVVFHDDEGMWVTQYVKKFRFKKEE